ncbi:ATP-dependent RNA helicase A [Cryptococcus wingfieldii CBS 7118]|uniref:RNA helicase n=1 Tax=Cryptococcus wingfieldii CBS 7118 TaxID=1295528 RepID=A0A1E3JBQ4_9TREE|nr:ATP-dependent RNA helicase A [Cryptococcus wingfieldii CBS 7118]ODN98303.1 ATP-dependent RNA helicase A [Cryptococcus wingfieldii CBS 7118]
MAPKRRPVNVVRSGNAGNSSKPSATPAAPVDPNAPHGTFRDGTPRPAPLFPAGYKTPIAVLNEKCQKMGWEKPVVESHANRGSQSFTGSVILKKRVSKNVYNLEEVRFVPHPPLEIATAAEAKHWAATYALFRFCSNLPMAMTLPPSIRPYWSTLTADKAASPPHRAWEFNPDPFAAKKEVSDRQNKRQEKEEEKTKAAESGSGAGSGRNTPAVRQEAKGGRGAAWDNAPEVKMAAALREMVEGTVRKMMQQFPSAVLEASRDATATASTSPSGVNTPALDLSSLQTQLTTLGFRPSHINSCTSAIASATSRLQSSSTSTKDPLVLALSILSPLEAAIEWLLLHVPEDDLPQRYRPSSSSADFITGSSTKSAGKSALVKSWLIDKLVKQAGFPRKPVEVILAEEECESAALDKLGRRLCGWEEGEDGWGVEEYGSGWIAGDEGAEEERKQHREEEVMALSAVLGERFEEVSTSEYTIHITPEFSNTPDSIDLHIIFDEVSPYPSAQHPTHAPTFYLSSETLPAYIRLHLHAQLMRQFRDPERHDLRSVLESGWGGAVLSMVEYLETTLQEAVDRPPDVGEVTKYLAPKVEELVPEVRAVQKRKVQQARNRGEKRKPTVEDEERVKRRRQAMLDHREYEAMMDVRMNLPAWKERNSITDALEQNRVLVVVGETGCGKSTQLPQFILDHEILAGRGASTNILVTQPRRVAAMGVASRVAQERMEDLDKSPGTVGYAIRGERRSGPDTSVLFCTTGVILRRLGSGDPDLRGVSHVVVDEAHERGVDTDLLICLLRDLLERNEDIKIILMSATINEQIFIDYFGGCPSLKIPGFTHPVKDIYLEDVISKLRYSPTPSRFGPRQTEEQKASLRAEFSQLKLSPDHQRALEVISASDRIDYGLVAAVVKHIVNTATSPDGAVLIFMPGVMEIRQCITELERASLGSVAIMPLHANLSSAEQRQVFVATKPRRKIVVATNVAETSVTIPDVIYVVDGGKVKETQYEAENGMQKLVECWTSRASGRQRRGRAGRTQPGECYKLYTRRTENNSMPRFPIPEILRTPLEALFLQVKAMNEDTDVKAFLGKAIDPPKMDAINAAWQTLQDLGAVEGEDHKSRLTALGRHMSSIPVDLRLAKMLVLGTIFKCLDPILTIAAILSSKPLFTSPIDKREESKKARESFAWAKSDLLTDVRAYDACMDVRKKGGSHGAVKTFCDDNFISFTTLRDITSLRTDFLSALSSLGFFSSTSAAELAKYNVNAKVDNLVKSVIVGGLYPRVVRVAMPKAQYERVQQGTIQKDHEAKEVKLFDQAGRVFVHPSSILFNESGFKSGYLAYFSKAETSKVFLRDATEVPLYGMLLFGGQITINHWAGGIMLGTDGHVKIRANTRIGVLCSQLRRLLDAQLTEQIESPHAADLTGHDDVVQAMLALLQRDGLTM